jgi:hypothetical protein
VLLLPDGFTPEISANVYYVYEINIMDWGFPCTVCYNYNSPDMS